MIDLLDQNRGILKTLFICHFLNSPKEKKSFHIIIFTFFQSGLDWWWYELMSGVRNLRDKLVKVGGRAIFQASLSPHSFTVASNNACTQLSHCIFYFSKVSSSISFLTNWPKLRRNRQPRWWAPWPGHHGKMKSKWRSLYNRVRHIRTNWSGHICSRRGQISLQQLGSNTKLVGNQIHLENVMSQWIKLLHCIKLIWCTGVLKEYFILTENVTCCWWIIKEGSIIESFASVFLILS